MRGCVTIVLAGLLMGPLARGWGGEASAQEAARATSFEAHRLELGPVNLEKINGPHRERVVAILKKPMATHLGRTELFPCHPALLEWLIDHPVAVAEYWKQLGISITEVERTENGYMCRDPSGSTVRFHVACDEPDMKVVYCVGESPAGILPFKLRAELVIVHRYRFEHYDGAGDYVVQRLDGYASAGGPTLKLAMKFAPGQSEEMVHSCVAEMKMFFSVMCRLMQTRPHWSLEKLASVQPNLTDQERVELESILRAMPTPTSRPRVARVPAAATDIRPVSANSEPRASAAR